MGNVTIGPEGLTLHEVENRIIELSLKDNPDDTAAYAELSALKEARMRYLDSEVREADGRFKPEYMEMCKRFILNDLLPKYFEIELKKFVPYPPEMRPSEFIGKEDLIFREVDNEDPYKSRLHKALLAGNDAFHVQERRRVGPIHFRNMQQTGNPLFGIPMNIHGYPQRFEILKRTHYLADLDIWSLKRIKVTIDHR